MTALTLFKNFERELNRPTWFTSPRFTNRFADFADLEVGQTLTSPIDFNFESNWDDKNSEWHLTMEAPGVLKENLKVSSEGDYLVVSGEKTMGLTAGKFEKKFLLPDEVDTEKIEAKFENAVLTLKLPAKSQKLAKMIEIK